MLHLRVATFAGLVVSLLAARWVGAATVVLNPIATGFWTSESAFLNGDAEMPPPSSDDAAGGVYQIVVTLSVSLSSADIAAGYTGLGNVAFDVNLSPGFSISPNAPAYFGYSPLALANGNKAEFIDSFGAPSYGWQWGRQLHQGLADRR